MKDAGGVFRILPTPEQYKFSHHNMNMGKVNIKALMRTKWKIAIVHAKTRSNKDPHLPNHIYSRFTNFNTHQLFKFDTFDDFNSVSNCCE